MSKTSSVLAALHRYKVGILVLSLALMMIFPSQVLAQTSAWSGVCVGGADNDVATIQGSECLIANVFMVIITLIGLAGFVMFIFGALRWMVSGSNAQGVTKARSTMLYAVAGLVIALSSFIIINLIADYTGVNVIRYFRIPTSTRGIPGIDCSALGGSCYPNSCFSRPNLGQSDCGAGNFCCGS